MKITISVTGNGNYDIEDLGIKKYIKDAVFGKDKISCQVIDKPDNITVTPQKSTDGGTNFGSVMIYDRSATANIKTLTDTNLELSWNPNHFLRLVVSGFESGDDFNIIIT